MNGIINVSKHAGCTSQHIVSRIKRVLHTRSVGHMGTLDPQGEGVLLVGVGKATRLFDIMLSKDKIYEASFKFGYETDTLDKDGVITDETGCIPTLQEIIDKLGYLTGKIEQLPPKYSAKNVNGVRAYTLARQGVEFELSPSSVEVFSFEYIKTLAQNEYMFRIHCSSGTYIRSLCRDLAYSLNSLATMTSIKRTKCGNFLIDDALTIDKIEEIAEKAVIPVEKALEFLPSVHFSDDYYKNISCGVSFDCDQEINQPFKVYCKNEFFGIGEVNSARQFKLKTYLKDDI